MRLSLHSYADFSTVAAPPSGRLFLRAKFLAVPVTLRAAAPSGPASSPEHPFLWCILPVHSAACLHESLLSDVPTKNMVMAEYDCNNRLFCFSFNHYLYETMGCHLNPVLVLLLFLLQTGTSAPQQALRVCDNLKVLTGLLQFLLRDQTDIILPNQHNPL